MDMETKRFENNQVTISGEIVSDFKYSHEVYGEKFYMLDISVPRMSDTYDVIPLMISDRLIDVTRDYTGCYLEAMGQFRSYNRHDETKNRLVLSVFVRELAISEDKDEDEDVHKPNQIFLDGYICKNPTYRKTPLGREIADILLAVNRPYGKSDYIPCIAWGRNARFAESMEISTRLKVWGRIQSREYQKKISDDEYETRTAYEVSISKLEVVEETEE